MTELRASKSAPDSEPALPPDPDPDRALREASPVLWETLSPLGRSLRMPANFLPQQTAEARGKRFNATIGQITDGHGRAVPLPSVAAGLAGLSAEAQSRALLYSPVEGIAELRERWRARQRRGQPADRPSSLPIATGGGLHALSLVAQLFAPAGRTVAVPEPPPAGWPEALGLRTGARIVPLAGFGWRSFDPVCVAEAVVSMPEREPAMLVLRLPATADGAPLSTEERTLLRDSLANGAHGRPLVVLLDDLWERFEPERGGASSSLFWDLVGAHPNLLPLKVDGAEGEIGYEGGRIAFLTTPFAPGSVAAAELESKVKLLLRAEIGSPSAASQMVLLAALAAMEPAA